MIVHFFRSCPRKRRNNWVINRRSAQLTICLRSPTKIIQRNVNNIVITNVSYNRRSPLPPQMTSSENYTAHKSDIIMPCELVRRHIPSCSSKFDVKIQNLEILDVGDYNISETITTTETWVAPFGSVTLAVELS